VFDPYEFEFIDWDDQEEEGSNLRHCLEHGVDEAVVDEVLRGRPVEVRLKLMGAAPLEGGLRACDLQVSASLIM
jgi:hypothetical protein